MVAFHAASCGYFFCFRFPGVMEFPRDIYDDIRDIYILAGLLFLHAAGLCYHLLLIRTCSFLSLVLE